MPNTNADRRWQKEKNKRGKLPERALSFHGGSPRFTSAPEKLTRPKTLPDLRSVGGFMAEERPKLIKLLLNVTIQRSPGAVQVLMSPESSVDDLIAAALRQYAKEGRRPILSSVDPSGFDLHYSQFSLESLEREEKLMSLGSRNFFLFPKRSTATESAGVSSTRDRDVGPPTLQSTCYAAEPQKVDRSVVPCLKFMDFLLVCIVC